MEIPKPRLESVSDGTTAGGFGSTVEAEAMRVIAEIDTTRREQEGKFAILEPLRRLRSFIGNIATKEQESPSPKEVSKDLIVGAGPDAPDYGAFPGESVIIAPPPSTKQRPTL